jgi:N-acetylmuramoyl-L-alanine amidase
VKICIDAGHGGNDPGARSQRLNVADDRYLEKDFTLSVALLLRDLFERNGVKLVMTRDGDRYVPLERRADIANTGNADLFLSVHANSCNQYHLATGMECWFGGSNVSFQTASCILKRMISIIPGHRNRGCKRGFFTVLQRTSMPAVLVECEFISNPEQARFLMNPENQTDLANAIFIGVMDCEKFLTGELSLPEMAKIEQEKGVAA